MSTFLSLHLHAHFVYASSEGFGESQPSLLDNAMSAGLSCAGPYALDSDCV